MKQTWIGYVTKKKLHGDDDSEYCEIKVLIQLKMK